MSKEIKSAEWCDSSHRVIRIDGEYYSVSKWRCGACINCDDDLFCRMKQNYVTVNYACEEFCKD